MATQEEGGLSPLPRSHQAKATMLKSWAFSRLQLHTVPPPEFSRHPGAQLVSLPPPAQQQLQSPPELCESSIQATVALEENPCPLCRVQQLVLQGLRGAAQGRAPIHSRRAGLLLDHLDDVLVLHEMVEAHPLGAVLGAGSLHELKEKEEDFSILVTSHIIGF